VDIEMTATFGLHVALALELLHAQELRESLAVLGDRERIARDLHDVVIQRLFAAGLSMQGLRRYTDDPVALERIDAVTTDLDGTIRELRDTIYSLRGAAGRQNGLKSLIVQQIMQVTEGLSYEPKVRFSGPIDSAVEPQAADNLLAVISEGLSNAARHSEASSIDVKLEVGRGKLQLVISDNGRGIQGWARRSGLDNIRQRAVSAGGTFEVRSSPDHGTELIWSVPLPAGP
jgi:signal transduction histidine kinase